MTTGTSTAVEAAPRLRCHMLSDGRIVGSAIVVVISVYVIAGLGHTYDDPFILYRYADNLLGGQGWTFNLGEPTANAATSTGYVLLLAAVSALGFPTPWAGSILFAIGLGAAAWFTFLTYRGEGGGTAAVLLILSPQIVSLRGMETAVLLGLIASAVWAARSQRDTAAALLVVAGFLVRPDAALLGLVLVGWRRIIDGRWPVRLMVVDAVAGVSAAAIVVATVGFPSTLAAKVAQRLSGIWTPFGRDAMEMSIEAWPWWSAVAIGMVLNRHWRDQPATMFAVLFVVAYAALGVASYPWYWAVPIYGAAVAAGSGLERNGLGVVSAAVLCALVAAGGGVSATLPPDRASYQAAGEWIRANTPADATVAATEIGMLGWYSQRDMRGYLGLLDAGLTDEVARGDFVSWLEKPPDYWVVSEWHRRIEQDARDALEGAETVWSRGRVQVLRLDRPDHQVGVDLRAERRRNPEADRGG